MAGEDLFREVRARIAIKIFPSAIGDIRTAVMRELSSMLLKSEPSLGGVPVAFSGMKLVGDSASIFEDQPHLHLWCAVTMLLFAPSEGQLIRGIVNNSASDSLGLLVLNTFNASITADGLVGYVFDGARLVWHREGDSEDVIEMGQELCFVCRAIKTHDNLVLISGELPHKSGGASADAAAATPRSGGSKQKQGKGGKRVEPGDEALDEEAGSKKKSARKGGAAGDGGEKGKEGKKEKKDKDRKKERKAEEESGGKKSKKAKKV